MKLERADDATKPENDKEYCLSVCLTDFDETRPRVQIFCLQRTFCLSIPIAMQCRFQLQVLIFFFLTTRVCRPRSGQTVIVNCFYFLVILKDICVVCLLGKG